MKKVINNVKGLGYDITDIKHLQKNTNGVGFHHIRHMINILKGEFTINTNGQYKQNENAVSLKPLADFISGL